jgi:hypothetical protein
VPGVRTTLPADSALFPAESALFKSAIFNVCPLLLETPKNALVHCRKKVNCDQNISLEVIENLARTMTEND